MKLSSIRPVGYILGIIGEHCPKLDCRIKHRWIVGRSLNLNHPRDLNDWINYLKFHVDLNVWARMADKFAVRDYVKERGLGNLLVTLYGRYDSVEDLLNDWERFPEKFVIKSNNGAGAIVIVNDKENTNLDLIKEKANMMLFERKFNSAEPHYKLIKNCIIVEELLEDASVKEFSRSLIDYKIWCFNGKPYNCFVVYDRDIYSNHHYFSCYDLDWNYHPEVMTNPVPDISLDRPKNFERMLEYASILSKGHPQCRVDFYNINGRIYFGELTMTSQGGFMDYFTKDYLVELGEQCKLNYESR